jgi:hypothetical protein
VHERLEDADCFGNGLLVGLREFRLGLRSQQLGRRLRDVRAENASDDIGSLAHGRRLSDRQGHLLGQQVGSGKPVKDRLGAIEVVADHERFCSTRDQGGRLDWSVLAQETVDHRFEQLARLAQRLEVLLVARRRPLLSLM